MIGMKPCCLIVKCHAYQHSLNRNKTMKLKHRGELWMLST